MNELLITRIWLIGLIGPLVGLIVGGIRPRPMLAYGASYTDAASDNGHEFVPTPNGFFWTTIAVMATGLRWLPTAPSPSLSPG